MKILCISDTHNYHNDLNLDLTDIDVIVHAGDFSETIRNCKEETLDFLLWYNSLNVKYKILVAGNHDLYLEHISSSEKIKLFREYTSIIYLEDSSIVIDNIKFHGSPYTPTFYNWSFMKNDDLLDSHWDLIPEDTNVLITHGPQYGVGDKVGNINAGSLTLKDKISNLKDFGNLKLHICGHIHEDAGIHFKDDLLTVNACSVDKNYYIKSAIIVNI